MNIGIMQPYFYPYIGYFQLIQNVDRFVVYDDIEYVKQSWFNRNRILQNGKPLLVSVPVKKASDFLMVRERELADTAQKELKKLRAKIEGCYRRAPHYKSVAALLDEGLSFESNNLFDFLLFNLKLVIDYLEISTPILISSQIGDFSSRKSTDKVISICKALNADQYTNSIGGQALYSKEVFLSEGVDLRFLKADEVVYEQLGEEFIPSLSIIDVIMFNDASVVRDFLTKHYKIL